MSKEQFTVQNNSEGDKPAIEIPKSTAKIGAAVLATIGITTAANTLGLFYSPKSPEKELSPADQVVQVVKDYSNGIIAKLPEGTEIHTVTLEEGDNPTSAAEKVMEEYNKDNPESKIDANEARSSIYETAVNMKDLYKGKTGSSELHPGIAIDIAVGDMNGDGKTSIAITGVKDE